MCQNKVILTQLSASFKKKGRLHRCTATSQKRYHSFQRSLSTAIATMGATSARHSRTNIPYSIPLLPYRTEPGRAGCLQLGLADSKCQLIVVSYNKNFFHVHFREK